MTLCADPLAAQITDQHIFERGSVRIMATGAGEGVTGPARITFTSNRMILHRVAIFHPHQARVTSQTKLADFCIKLKRMIGGVGAMAGATTLCFHDAVDNKILRTTLNKFLHIFVANHTQLGFTVGP